VLLGENLAGNRLRHGTIFERKFLRWYKVSPKPELHWKHKIIQYSNPSVSNPKHFI
jgi:hypothetical protein